MASSAIFQVVSVAHILHIAVSIRRSPALRSSSDEVRNVIASMAKTFPAISAIFPAVAACLPMGTPHWVRSLGHLREIWSSRLDRPTHAAGDVNRPVLKDVIATFNPAPCLE